MPDKEVLDVTITTIPPDRKMCKVVPDFVAKRNSTVKFKFDEFGSVADIIFTNGPFESDRLKPGSHKVRGNATPGPLKFTVVWPGGQGGGQGEVIGG